MNSMRRVGTFAFPGASTFYQGKHEFFEDRSGLLPPGRKKLIVESRGWELEARSLGAVFYGHSF
jgi:hypothetical protein